jgi:hypothetical protein
MTRDDIVSMVQEVIITNSNRNPLDFRLTTLEQIEHFAALVTAAEREACAKVCEELNAWNEDDPGSSAAAAIRARGQA